MANKKYYWLKLKEDFFRQKEIKKLRRIAGGDTYTIIYLKMLLLALKNDNKLYFEGVEEDFADELALELDEDEENVKMTLAFLQNQRLIEMISEDEYVLPQCKSMTGVESSSAERVRRHRLKQKEQEKALQCNTDVTDSNKNVATEIETEKEIDIEQQHIKPVVVDNEIERSLVIVELKKAYNQLGDKDIKKIADTLSAKRENYDLDYLKEKIELSKRQSNIRNLVGFLIKAINKDFTSESISNFDKSNSGRKQNPKVHNFIGSDGYSKYSEEELERIILENQKNKFK
ncbi:phage replisome organizer N-terminal domain-containing protein [Paraclostridium benzoelyticum]|nr:phage replisome organizer N-terminal domain-containing protein [Paraclostridium benzoelyticum]